MKRLVTLFLVVLSFVSWSQNKQILYGFSEIPQSLLQNPGGKVSNRAFFGVPLVSHVHVNGGTSGVTAYDLFADNGVDFNTKLQNAVYASKSKDFFSFNEQLEVFSGGFAFGNRLEKNQFLSFGMYQELDLIGYFPKDIAVLALEGNLNNLDRVFDASHVNISAEVLSVFHVGYNKKLNDKFTYGLRGKIYSSAINLNSTNNRGSFVTVQGDNNFYNHVFNLDTKLKTSGLAQFINDDESDANEGLKSVTKRLFFAGNLGLGADFGFNYKVNDQWDVDASLLDVGFISHTKDVETYSVHGDYAFEGINPVFQELQNGQTADEYWSEIKEELEELFEPDTTVGKYTTWRPTKFNASINYSFGKKKEKDCDCKKDDQGYINRFGFQLYAINRPKQPQLALTTYYYRKISNGLRVKATYTVDSFSFYNIGLGISAHLGPVNFYLMADNFLQYKNIYNAEGVSLQLGFNYIFKKNED